MSACLHQGGALLHLLQQGREGLSRMGMEHQGQRVDRQTYIAFDAVQLGLTPADGQTEDGCAAQSQRLQCPCPGCQVPGGDGNSIVASPARDAIRQGWVQHEVEIQIRLNRCAT